MSNTDEFNVRFFKFKEHYWETYCVFEINPRIASAIREHSKCYEKVLDYYLNADNQFVYGVNSKDADYLMTIVREIERISNEKDTDYFLNHLISDNGSFNDLYKVRELLKKDFGIKDGKIPTRVMLFFSDLMNLYFIW